MARCKREGQQGGRESKASAGGELEAEREEKGLISLGDLCVSNPAFESGIQPPFLIPFSVCVGICCQSPPSSSSSGRHLALAAQRPRPAPAASLPHEWVTSDGRWTPTPAGEEHIQTYNIQT